MGISAFKASEAIEALCDRASCGRALETTTQPWCVACVAGATIVALDQKVGSLEQDLSDAGDELRELWDVLGKVSPADAEQVHADLQAAWTEADRDGRAPIYRTKARFIERIREVARECGYAIAVHGSEKRDLDLMALPWTAEAESAQALVATLCDRLGLRAREVNVYDRGPGGARLEPTPEIKPWGRIAWSLDGVPGRTWQYIDLSVGPRCGEAVPVRTYVREVRVDG